MSALALLSVEVVVVCPHPSTVAAVMGVVVGAVGMAIGEALPPSLAPLLRAGCYQEFLFLEVTGNTNFIYTVLLL